MVIVSASLISRPPKSGTVTVRAVVKVGKEVVGTDELGTVNGDFELLAGGVLGAAANFGAAFGTDCSFGWNS